MVLSAAVQTGSLGRLTGCFELWTSKGNNSYVVFTLHLFSFGIVDSFLFRSPFLKISQVLQLIYGLFWTGHGTE